MTPTELYKEVARMVKPFDSVPVKEWLDIGDEQIIKVFKRERFNYYTDPFCGTIVFNKKIVLASQLFWVLCNSLVFKEYNIPKGQGVSMYYWRKYLKTMTKDHKVFKEFKKELMRFALTD